MTERFELGMVLKPQGIKGEIKLAAYTDDLSRFSYLSEVLLEDKEGGLLRVSVESARVDSQFAYLKLEGYNDRNSVEGLRGRVLYVDRHHAAKLPEGLNYICDLIGLSVRDASGTEIGVLNDILQNGAADVYVVQSGDSEEMMFPSIPGVVLRKDVAEGVIVVDADRLQEVCVYDHI